MKISIITHGAHGGNGGIDKYSAYVIDALAKNKLVKSIDIFSKKIIKFNNKKTNKFCSGNNIGFILLIFTNIINILKSNVIIVSHINHVPLLLIPILLNKKIVLFSYGYEIRFVTKNFFYKLLIKRINFFICMRGHTLKILKKKYNLKYKNFYLLPNCIKLRKLRKLKTYKHKNIITIARLMSTEKFKGVDETLEALSLLKKINFLYFVVGDGDDKQRLIKKAKKLNIIKNVKFFGQVSNNKRDKLLQSSSLISMPGSNKYHDTYPPRFAFLEAAEFGLKILGTNPFPSEKYFEKKYKSLNFVNPHNKEQILNKILKLQKQTKQYDKKILKDFSFDNFSKKLNNIFLEIIEK